MKTLTALFAAALIASPAVARREPIVPTATVCPPSVPELNYLITSAMAHAGMEAMGASTWRREVTNTTDLLGLTGRRWYEIHLTEFNVQPGVVKLIADQHFENDRGAEAVDEGTAQFGVLIMKALSDNLPCIGQP